MNVTNMYMNVTEAYTKVTDVYTMVTVFYINLIGKTVVYVVFYAPLITCDSLDQSQPLKVFPYRPVEGDRVCARNSMSLSLSLKLSSSF